MTHTCEGVLNGLAPWRAEWRFVGSKWMGAGNYYDSPSHGLQWCVVDAEGSLSAIVQGGEEMAEFFAAQLNRLAAHTCEGDNCIGCPTCARAGKYQACGYVCGHDNGEGE